MHFDLAKHTIFETIVGSQVYGVAGPTSDTDYRGVVVPPRAIVQSAFKRFEQAEFKDPDRVLYDIRKFVMLAADCNPTIIELFFIPERFWQQSSACWDTLYKARSLFLSTQACHTFSGYAIQQLKRMQIHVRWMQRAPVEPKPEDFGLSHALCLGKDEVGAYDWLVAGAYVRFSKEIMQLMSRVKGYQQALKEWKNYQEWKTNRNPARAALEQRYGYDTKHAYHLVRLARLGEELLATGTMTLADRVDQDELRAIRNGAWSYDQIMAFTEQIDARMAACEARSALPKAPDRAVLDGVCNDVMEAFWCSD